MIVGTAGHIDHGKTSLVKALTGVDTDRLKEEKARGITIELGFAYWPRPGLGDGQSIVGFVDVPGHERLVHTMLAGATGIDLVLLVVAADDGVMPQTREHLAIIDLLGLTRGIVALSKCDLAGAPRRAEVTAQIRELLADSGLQEAPVIPVSSTTGEGMGELVAALDAAMLATAAQASDGRFRLAVDRVFSLAGAGTVVTGTVLSGGVATGDQVTVSPAGIAARVRSIHAQGRPAERGRAGERCAIALVGPDISTESVRRGSVVLASSLHAPAKRIDATLSLLASERRPLGQWVPVRVHHAATEALAHALVLRDASLAPGESDFVQLVLDQPIAAAAGDRYVLRDTSATRTIGGGRFLDLAPPERRRRTPERRAELAALGQTDMYDALIGYLGGGRGWVDLEAFFRDRAAPEDAVETAVVVLELVTLTAGPVTAGMLPTTWEGYAQRALATLEAFHRDNRDQPGMVQERLRAALQPRLPADLFLAALHKLQAAKSIALDRSWVRLPTHAVKLSAEDERNWNRIHKLLGGVGRFQPPRVRDLAVELKLAETAVRRLCKLAAKRGDLDEIAPDHFFRASVTVELADMAREIAGKATDGRFTVIEFRDRVDNGRKAAIHILEFFDKQGLTMRRGDHRQINPHKARLFSRE